MLYTDNVLLRDNNNQPRVVDSHTKNYSHNRRSCHHIERTFNPAEQ
jgi:hypothetical protein